MIKRAIDYIRTEIGWPILIFTFMMTAKVLGMRVGAIDQIVYVLVIATGLYAFSKKSSFDNVSLMFIVYIPIALLISQPDPVFKSWMRYFLFLFLYLVCSPLIKGRAATVLRKKILICTLGFCTIIGIISFFCYFLGINYMRNTYTGDEMLDFINNSAGSFGGITTQSMLLGPISAIGVLSSSYLALIKDKKIFWIMAALCMGCVLFSASRSSLLSTLVGGLVLFRYFAKVGNKYMKRTIIVLLVAAASFPVWNSALGGMINKNEGSITNGISVNSRSSKWKNRLSEFNSSPVFGIGFVSVKAKGDYSALSGIIEPGSSWLAVLSMEGVIGFVLFCTIFFRAWRNSTHYGTPEGALLAAILILVGVHMVAEGHIFSGGSFLCFLVWIIIGCATDYKPSLYNKSI